jgi:hypothetical protein
MEPKKVITLFDDVPGGESVRSEYEIPEDGVLESGWFRNYRGHEFDLRYSVYVRDQQGRRRSPLVQLGKEYLTGDDDIHDLDLRWPVSDGDTLVIEADNNEPEYLYHANARVSIDYEGGLIGAVRNLIPGGN